MASRDVRSWAKDELVGAGPGLKLCRGIDRTNDAMETAPESCFEGAGVTG